MNFEEQIEKLENRRKKDNIVKIILIIIIIILLFMFFLLGWRVGKIGYGEKQISVDVNSSKKDKEEKVSEISIKEGDVEIEKGTLLNIFNNEDYEGEKIVLPGSERKI